MPEQLCIAPHNHIYQRKGRYFYKLCPATESEKYHHYTLRANIIGIPKECQPYLCEYCNSSSAYYRCRNN